MDQVSTPLSSRIRHGLKPDFREVAAQLHRGLDLLIGAKGVDQVLDEPAARFADARARRFLTLLVHRDARSDLRSVTHGARAAVPGTAHADAPLAQAPSVG